MTRMLGLASDLAEEVRVGLSRLAMVSSERRRGRRARAAPGAVARDWLTQYSTVPSAAESGLWWGTAAWRVQRQSQSRAPSANFSIAAPSQGGSAPPA